LTLGYHLFTEFLNKLRVIAINSSTRGLILVDGLFAE